MPRSHSAGAIVLLRYLLVLIFLSSAIQPTANGDISARRTNGAPTLQGAGDWLIVPGKRVGAVALGDNEEKVLQLFPQSSIGSYTQPGPAGIECGKGYTIGLLEDARHPGFLNVFVKGGKVAEVEAEGARYHTRQGLASGSSPDMVRLAYPGMNSYLFLGGHYDALNNGPLVLWTDERQGIAFSFAYPTRRNKSLLVFTTIIFKPGAPVCVQGSPFPDASLWRKLPPHSLGALDDKI